MLSAINARHLFGTGLETETRTNIGTIGTGIETRVGSSKFGGFVCTGPLRAGLDSEKKRRIFTFDMSHDIAQSLLQR